MRPPACGKGTRKGKREHWLTAGSSRARQQEKQSGADSSFRPSNLCSLPSMPFTTMSIDLPRFRTINSSVKSVHQSQQTFGPTLFSVHAIF